jgi:hypothetical protein
LCFPCWPEQKGFSPLFVDITKSAGIEFSHYNGSFGKKFLPETMGSGCAFFDYDNDGWVDLFLVNSTDWPNHASAPRLCRLYRNNRDGTFVDVSRETGLDIELYGMGVAVGDYDNDGWDDLYVSGLGGGRLFRNEAGRFRDMTQKSGTKQRFRDQLHLIDFDQDGQLICFSATMNWRWKLSKSCSMIKFIRVTATPPITPG